MIGTVIQGRYRLDQLLGEGGFGAVYRARHLTMDHDVAIKILHAAHADDPLQAQRFELEARRSCQLAHPNTIRVFDFGETRDGSLFLAMEYLDGHTLKDELRGGRVIAVGRAVHILEQVFDALSEAHDLGLVHRDLKPDNIFLTRIAGKSNFVKVLDFGIAKAIRQSTSQLTGTGTVIGTASYMSPEQCYGRRLDGRSDLYAMGCVAYHMLAGRPPFHADQPMGYLLQHAQTTPPDIREVASAHHEIPDGVAEVVHTLLNKHPDERYPNARAVIDALKVAVEGHDVWEYVPETSAVFDPLAVALDPYAGEYAPPTEALPKPDGRRGGLQTASQPLSTATGLARVDAPANPTVAAPPTQTPRPVWPWLGGGAALVVAAAVLLLASGGDDVPPHGETAPTAVVADVSRAPEPVAAPTATPDTTEPDVVEPAPVEPDTVTAVDTVAPDTASPLVTVALRTRPAGAKVYRQRELLGATPLDVSWTPDAGADARSFTLVLPGYARREVTLPGVPDRDTYDYRLSPARAPVANQPDEALPEPKKW